MSFSDTSSSPYPPTDHLSDRLDDAVAYPQLLAAIQAHFTAMVTDASEQDSSKRVRLFTTQTPDLFEIFLSHLPAALQQRYTCSVCRKFVENYGSLVTVTPSGTAVPVIWGLADVPALYAEAVSALSAAVAKAPISGVFLPETTVWGCAEAGGWQHFSVVCPEALVFKPSPVQTTAQRVAEKNQDYQILLAGLEAFPLKLVQKAHRLLTTGSLYRSEKCIEVAKWLVDLHQQRKAVKNKRHRENVTWLAVAAAPPGFCHVRSSMIGTLLSDLKAGMAFGQIKARFDAKMDPLKYQRSQVAPKAGNIERAEKIVEQLRSAGALARRFATVEEVQAIWRPADTKTATQKAGVFSHLKAALNKEETDSFEGPPVVMTWEKFARTVLPTAKSIEYFAPPSKQSFMGMVTAQDLTAPPIIQWDFEGQRNPFTWYFYTQGSVPERWNLKSNAYHAVTAVVLQPSMWDETRKFSHQGKKVFFLLKGAKDKDYRQGCGFYTEFLKRDYYEVRSTLEAYAKSAVVAGKNEATACGVGCSEGGTWNKVFRVTSQDGLRVTYKLDRWD